MKHLLAPLALSLALASPAVSAGCRSNDSWHGADKNFHLVLGGTVSAAMTFQTRSAWEGFAWGVGIGAVKEVVDIKLGNCTLQDFAVTAIGAGLGAAGSKFLLTLTPDGKGAAVVFRTEL